MKNSDAAAEAKISATVYLRPQFTITATQANLLDRHPRLNISVQRSVLLTCDLLDNMGFVKGFPEHDCENGTPT